MGGGVFPGGCLPDTPPCEQNPPCRSESPHSRKNSDLRRNYVLERSEHYLATKHVCGLVIIESNSCNIGLLRLVELKGKEIGPILKVHYIFILTQAAIRKATRLDLSCNILTSLPVSTNSPSVIFF